VVGQGPAAAAVMGQLRSALSAYLLRAASPAEALQWLDSWSARVRGARASTAICVVVDTATGELRWARAGHPPPLVVGVDGTTRYLHDATGAVLGVRGAPPFTDGHDRLEPGDTVVLYTDGLIEHQRTGIDEGLLRLSAVLAGLAGRSASEICDEVLHRLITGPADDDVALLVVRPR
jgi:serine phosphatase RsbU (regulator of sigma subunit)